MSDTKTETRTLLDGWDEIRDVLNERDIVAQHPSDYHLPRDPYDMGEYRGYVTANDKLVIGVRVHDQPHGENYFDTGDGLGEVLYSNERRNVPTHGVSEERIRGEIESAIEKGSLVFFVDYRDYGPESRVLVEDHTIKKGTRTLPVSWWTARDEHSCDGIFIPCEDVQEQYQKNKRKLGVKAARAKALADSESVFDEYEEWINGRVYGIATLVVDLATGRPLGEPDSCWQFVGDEYALKELVYATNERIEEVEAGGSGWGSVPVNLTCVAVEGETCERGFTFMVPKDEAEHYAKTAQPRCTEHWDKYKATLPADDPLVAA